MDDCPFEAVARRQTRQTIAVAIGVVLVLSALWLLTTFGFNIVTVAIGGAALAAHIGFCFWYDRPASPAEFRAMLADYDRAPSPQKLDAILDATKLPADQIRERINGYRAAQGQDRSP